MAATAPASHARALALLAGAAVACSLAPAATIQVIYTKITGHPTAIVPGSLTLAGTPETIEFRSITDVAVSPDGTQWILNGTTMNGAAANNHDSIILKGSGTTGTMFLQEGQPAPFGNSPDWISFMPSGFGKFNDNNDLAVGIRARTVQDGTTSSPNPTDGQRVLRWSSAGGFAPGPKQGQSYVGTGTPGNIIGNSFSSFHYLNDGRVGAVDTTVNGSSTINYLFYNNATGNNIFKTKNSSTVLSLDGLSTHVFGGFAGVNPSEFTTTPNGAHWMTKGTIQGAATTEDTIWTYDGQVRLREGWAIPGSSPSFVVGDINQYFIAGNHWIARGRNVASTAVFVVADGVLVAQTGSPITTGSTEHWGNSFVAVSINANGDYVVDGNTDNPNTAIDNVMVMNGESVVIREGDMVDLNQNGLNDDDCFLGRAGTLQAFDVNDTQITNSRMVYFIGYLKNAAGVDLGVTFNGPQAFLRVQAPPAAPPCGSPDFDCDGDTGTDFDIQAFFACLGGNCPPPPCTSSADFDGDGDTGTDFDIQAFFRVLGGGTC